MLDAAQKVIEKYEELESELSTPEVVADQKLYTKLQKQYKGLEKSCQKAREYIQLSSDLAEWKAALGGSDPEFAEAAKALAKELAPSNIKVNAIACGIIDTRMNAEFSAEEKQILESEVPIGRFGRPDEVADFAWQLANAPDYLTGQVITLDGGWQ